MVMSMYPVTPIELVHIQSYLCFYQSASSFLSGQISPDHHDHWSSKLVYCDYNNNYNNNDDYSDDDYD